MFKILQKTYRRGETKLMQLMFWICGGFYYSDIVTNKTRNAALVINVANLLYGCFISPVGFYLTTENKTSTTTFNVIAITMTMYYVGVIVPGVTYFCQEDIRKVLDEADNEFDCHEPEVHIFDINRKKRNNSYVLKMLIFLVSVELIYASINIPYALLFLEESNLNDQALFPEGVPFVEHMHSWTLFLLTSVLQCIHIFIYGMEGNCMTLLGLMIVSEFYNAAVNLNIQLHHMINNVILNLNMNKSEHMQGEEKYINLKMYEKFKTDLGIIVKRYGTLTR